ncbi:MAG: tRNA preQ1(34) S-adenosylmethionine ribosyltransferase-isomerase QueA, partial [Clostridia bacterium]
KVGVEFKFGEKLSAKVKSIGEGGTRTVEFKFEGVFENILREIGEMPLPHYIKQKITNGERYNTVYSKVDGSAAAPTAGLHFTAQLLEKIKEKGVIICEVLLHVGLGTFRPVKTDDITEHKMHSEHYEVTKQTAEIINCAKKEKRRVIAVGTTTVRVLESVADENGCIKAESGETCIFIYPPYKYKIVDALITNFHLPESTLIMLVSALAGRDKVLQLYKEAVKEKYRFFSFGDAMLIE